jgi:uncharacterized iron-regulated protein
MRALCIAFMVVLSLTGCASVGSRAAAPVEPRSVPAFHGDSGQRADWGTLVETCRDADIVIIGENHGHPVGLPFAAALWEDVLAAAPTPTTAALALEFFERDEQSRIDEYLAGVTDEPTFRKRTQRTQGNYPDGHRAMVEAAKKAGRPVIAANAPRPVVRLARLEGYERVRSLSPELQRLVRIPDSLPEGRYKDDFIKFQTGTMPDPHAKNPPNDPPPEPTPEAIERASNMFRSQSLWDWTMADSVVRAVQQGNRPVFLVVGRFHADHHGGLVQAINKMRPGAKVVVMSVVDETSNELREHDKGRGAFVAYVGPSESE